MSLSKNAGNQGGDVENQSGNLGISGRNDIGKQWNDKCKERREIKIIENEQIFKNLVLQILFLLLLWTYFPQCLYVFVIEFGQVNTV